ncbi:hypothetical protein FB192DRAFT_1382593, partial [Mucor lusitanicus]
MVRFLQQLPALTALLSSSCCVIQLALNFFSVSCAGFAVFTPYRSVLSTFTVFLLGYNLVSTTTSSQARQKLVILVVSVLLMVSPEIVQWVNQSPAAASTAKSHYYRIHLDGLGCEACANRIKSTLISTDWISDATVYFSNQTAIVQIKDSIAENTELVDLIRSIDNKYDAQVLDSWV